MNAITWKWAVSVFQQKTGAKKAASLLVTLLTLLLITQVVVAATVVNMCFTGTGPGQSISGTLGGVAKNPWAGVFKITVNGVAQLGFCTDLNNSISSGSCYSSSVVGAAAPKVACTVRDYPPETSLTNVEASARQAAVWKFSDGYIITGPADVKTRADAIIADIEAKFAVGLCDPAPAPTMSINPSSATNFLIPDNGGYLYSPHDFTIKLLQGNLPIVGKSVHVTTSAGVFDPSGLTAIDVVTDQNGEAVVTVKNNVVSTATLTASATVILPAGTRIDPGATIQKIVLNGTTEYPMSASATKNWVAGSKIIVKKFQDTNRNQVKENDEPWLRWKIFYREHATPEVFPPTTGWSSGFTDASTGLLTIAVDPTKTYDICENVYASDATLIDWEPTTPSCNWNVAPGSVAWFGNVRKPAIWILKYLDYNGNGLQDLGEPGADGWEFQVDRWDKSSGGVYVWQPTYSGQTSGGGYLGFSYVLSKNADGGPLKYRITEILPPDWALSGPTANQVEFTITGQEVYPFTFGNLKPGKLIINKHWFTNELEVNPPATPAEVCIKLTGTANPLNNLIPQDATGTPLVANASGYYCQNISGQVTFKNLWPGVYDVMENSPAGWFGQAVIDDQTILSAGEVSLSINNTRDQGYLKLSKIFDPLGSGYNSTFAIKYNCGAGDVTVNLVAGGSTTVGPFDTGTVCTVSEPNLPVNPDGWVFGTPVVVGSPATIVKGDQAVAVAVSVTNTVSELSKIKVTKVVDWKGIEPDQQQSFTICIKGPSYPNGNEQGACQTLTYQGGELWWRNLIPGQYSVSEQNPGGQWIVEITTSPINLVAGATGEVTVKNTRRLGGLTVTKVVNWNGIPVDTAQQFTICIKGPSYPTGTEPLACKLYTYAGGTLVWDGLLPGIYEVSEQALGSLWDVVIQNSPVEVSIYGQDAHANVINTRKLGNLKVLKVVNWNGVTPDTAKVFTICIQGPSYPSTPNCKPVGYNGGAVVWENILPGVYLVTEQNPGSQWAVNLPVGAVQVIGDGSTVQVSILNTHLLGDLKVTKIVDWGQADYDPTKTFTICIKGASYPAGDEAGACKTVGADGGVMEWKQLLPGIYTVVEEFPGGDWAIDYVGAPADVQGGKVAQATVTNTNTTTTAVTLKYFKAQWVHGRNVNLMWATAVEFDNYGFEVYRSAVNDFKTAEIIGFVSSQAGTGKGSVYSLVDGSAPAAGKYYYWLVDISNTGKQTLNGNPLNGLAVKVLSNDLYLPGIFNR